MLRKVSKSLSDLKKSFEHLLSGPTDYTIDDFVRMIVEQQITVIIMLSFTHDPLTSTYAVSPLK
jgi:hypothetical protein